VNQQHEEVIDEMAEAEIDDNLADSFPASDPPSWTLGTDHNKQSSAIPRKTSVVDSKGEK
jgi:hypothetical protein